jgi:ATP-binding cassette subfamily B protein
MSIDVMDWDEAAPAQKNELRESGLKDITLLKKLWPFIRPEKKGLLAAFLMLPLITLAEMLQPFIVRRAIDGPVAQGDVQGLLVLAGMFLGLLTVHYTLRYFQMKIAQISSGRIILALRTRLYEHLQTLSPRFYHRFPIGKLLTRITSDVENLSEMLSSGGIAILADLGIIFGAAIGMIIMEPKLALFTLMMLPVLFATMEFFRRRSRRAYDEIRVNVARLNAYLQENISGMEVVQLFQREKRNFKDFKTLNDQNLKVNLNSVFYDSSLSAVIEFLTNITLILVLWIGGEAIIGEEMTFGLLVAFFQFVQMMFNPIEDVSEKYTIIQSGLASIDKIMALFNQSAETVSPPDPTPLPRARGHLRFDGVSFGYLPNQPVLKEVSFEVQPGQKVALVGPSGSGKTTLIKLLSRFYDVTAGEIQLDGHPLRHYALDELRRNIVVIQQDDFLFSRPVSENISLEDAHEVKEVARLTHALTLSNAMAVVDRLPNGVDEPLRERGKNLSSGEKQLLLFARAIYHDPPILILDEATSAIDPHTEALVQEAMERVMAGRTVLLIAHRLTTIRQADLILVLDEGRLIESGNHDQLMAHNGTYAKFYRYQQALEEFKP